MSAPYVMAPGDLIKLLFVMYGPGAPHNPFQHTALCLNTWKHEQGAMTWDGCTLLYGDGAVRRNYITHLDFDVVATGKEMV